MRKTMLVAAVMLLVVSIAAGVKAPFVYAESEVPSDQNALNKLVPLPDDVQVKEGSLELTKQVNLLGAESADPDALKVLKDFLASHQVEINTEIVKEDTTIAIGEEGHLSADAQQLADELEIKDASSLKAEGYTLDIQSEATELNQGGTVFIKGIDGDGTFYGVKTLIQLAETDQDLLTFKNVSITDEPSMSVRGIVEGFYGDPWSHGDRIDQIKFYGDYKMNTYIYAPKDDPYHREKWREPYPDSELGRMKELIDTANENKVDFIFAISPGIDIVFDGEQGEKDFQALLKKSQSLYDMGVRDFAILFDDIYGKDGLKHAQLLNRFNEEFIQKKKDVKPLITVPTEYDTHAMGVIDDLTTYTKALSENLDKDVLVMWTGQAVVSESLPLENVEFMRSVYGDRIGVWWNYPVSDYLTSKLALGPIVDIDKSVEGKLDFFTMNPMEHANLSKISLATGADFSWNIAEYDSDRSWNRSIDLLFGDLAEDMKTFANHSSRMTGAWNVGREDAIEVQEVIEEFWVNVSKGQNAEEEISKLESEFADMQSSAATLKEELPQSILDESSKNLDKLQQLGENGQLALDMVLAKVNKDDGNYDKLKEEIQANLPTLTSGARVSEETVLAFVKEAMEFDTMPVVSFDVSKTLVAPGEEIEFTSTSSLTAEKLSWTFEGAKVEQSTEQNPKVVYEKEGRYTVKLVGKNALGEDEVVKENLITVTDLAKEKTTNLALNKSATASSVCADSEAAKFALDGSLRTKWCANGEGPHTLTVDLGSANLVTEIVLKHAEEGGEPAGSNTKAYRVLVSKDGENFEELVNVTNNKKGLTKDQVPATVGQYVRLIVDEPTQGDDNAARIYEMEVNGLTGDVELPPVYTPEPQIDDAAGMIGLVKKMSKEGSINKKAIAPLTVNLKMVQHFEKKDAPGKVIKHMKLFKLQLFIQKRHGWIDQNAYEVLSDSADNVIEKWS